LETTEAHVVMSRCAARDVLRQLALLLLDGAELTTDRFSEIVATLKTDLDLRSANYFTRCASRWQDAAAEENSPRNSSLG